MPDKITLTHYLDGAFLEGRAPRKDDLEVELKPDHDSRVVTCLFSTDVSYLALLPDEARDLACSLIQCAEVLDPPEDSP